jgi:starch phosphorylase
LQVLGPKVLASRMVRDYTEQYYLPAARSLRRTIDPAFAPATELTAYRAKVAKAWPTLTITDVDATGLPDTPLLGSELTLSATVQLAGLCPADVVVQALVGRVDTDDQLLDPVTVPMAHTGSFDGGLDLFSTTTPLPVAGSVGYTVRVLPHNDLLADDNELGLVRLA